MIIADWPQIVAESRNLHRTNHSTSIAHISSTLLFLTGEEKIVQMLIDKGGNINAVDANHDTALIHAANLGNVKLL